jgi:hypothetical protein
MARFYSVVCAYYCNQVRIVFPHGAVKAITETEEKQKEPAYRQVNQICCDRTSTFFFVPADTKPILDRGLFDQPRLAQ